ncbi:MAG: hypothetical protein ACSHW7_14950 [Patiriisocius sp.]|uniref:hypothetical protein n=1 Tax=Patiriisocius sp. TaxID=2822396 RepID=UPI003EF1392C
MKQKTAIRTAGTFFGIGTVLFLFELFTKSHELLFIGFVFIVIAVIFNSITFLVLLIELIRKDSLEAFFSICIICSNIPIAMGYYYLLTHFNH